MTPPNLQPLEPPAPAIIAADVPDTQRILDTLTLAFAADPAVRWMYPDPHQYLRCFPAFAQAFGGAALTRGTAFTTDDYAGTALWLPPDAGPDEPALAALLAEGLADRERANAFAVFEEMARYHPTEPHWHLPLLGVEPTRQGRGAGSALLRAGLRHCDRTQLPAYLESTNPRNIPLYQRHGFEVLGMIRVGRCPPIVPMLRSAGS